MKKKIAIILLLLFTQISNISFAKEEATTNKEEVVEVSTYLTGADVATVNQKRVLYDNGSASSFTSKSSEYAMGSTEWILNHFTNNDPKGFSKSLQLIYNTISRMVLTYFMGPFFLISLIYNYYTQIVKGKSTFDWNKLVGDVCLLFFISQYGFVMEFLSYIMNILPWLMLKSFENIKMENAYVQFLEMVNAPEYNLTLGEKNNLLEFVREYGNKGSDPAFNNAALNVMLDKKSEGFSLLSTFSVPRILSSIVESIQFITSLSLVSALAALGAVAKHIVLLVIFGAEKTLLALGPLAIVASYIGIFKDKWKTFLTTWITLKGCIVTLVTIDGVLLIMNQTEGLMFDYDTGSPTDIGFAFSISAMVLYVLCPWLTSIWIGSESAGKVLSTAIAGATYVASKIMASVGGGGSKNDGGNDKNDSLGKSSNIGSEGLGNSSKGNGGSQQNY